MDNKYRLFHFKMNISTFGIINTKFAKEMGTADPPFTVASPGYTTMLSRFMFDIARYSYNPGLISDETLIVPVTNKQQIRDVITSMTAEHLAALRNYGARRHENEEPLDPALPIEASGLYPVSGSQYASQHRIIDWWVKHIKMD